MADDLQQIVGPDKAEPQSFGQLLWVEWAKFRTSRGRMIGMAVAALVIVSLGLLFAAGHRTFKGPNGQIPPRPSLPLGPDGEAVIDKFYFMHQPLTGDGSITARVTSLTGIITYPPPNHDEIVSGVVPWAKAGVLIKESTKQGSTYAAVMLTGSHGVRMQYNFIEDIAGRPGEVSEQFPRWLRLTRLGDTLTGYESSDGTQWTEIGTAHLTGLPTTVEAGLFVTSPSNLTLSEGAARLTQATGVFDHVRLEGNASGKWSGDNIGRLNDRMTDLERFHRRDGVVESGGTFTVSGSGDIAPGGFTQGQTIERTLFGTFLGAIVVIVVAVTFFTADYQPTLNRTAPAHPPAPWRVLAAKAIVIGAVTFVAGLAAALVVVLLGVQILRNNGLDLLPVTLLTKLRVIVGTAALLALFAILALALGALFRRRFAAVAAAIVVIVVPYVAAIALVLPGSESQWEPRLAASQWLLRLTPAAGFAIQQSIPEYAHVIGPYTVVFGYYPLAPWAGFAVLCGYTALALGVAGFLLRQRHA
jgi:ABC-type transport system involved in multi-copper enzyme maturation permease subunit